MDREDMMYLIRACRDFKRLDDALEEIGGGIDNDKFRGLWDLSDLIVKYSKLRDYDEVLKIIDNNKLTIGQMVDMLV